MRRSPRRHAARKDSCTSAGQLSGVRMRMPRARATSLRSASAKPFSSLTGSGDTKYFRRAPSLRGTSGAGKRMRSHRIVFAVTAPQEDSVTAVLPGPRGLALEQAEPTPESDEEPAQPRLVLTIGLTAEDRYWLERIEGAERFRYQPLGDPLAGENPEVLRPREFVRAALEELRALPRKAAGIIAADDYPATLLAAAVRDAAGLPGPSFEASLKCAHKGWSRLLQRQVAPEAVPRFQLIDPYREYGTGDLGLRFPFWVKPVKSALSYL